MATSEEITKFWSAMIGAFGSKWSGGYGEQPTRVWAAELAKLSRDELALGYRAVMDAGEEWPPTLPAFLRLCRPGNEEQRARDALLERSERERAQALPSPDALMAASEMGRKWLAFCIAGAYLPATKRMSEVESLEIMAGLPEGEAAKMDAAVQRDRAVILAGERIHDPREWGE